MIFKDLMGVVPVRSFLYFHFMNKKRNLYLKYSLFWIVFFLASRAFFFLFNIREAKGLGIWDFLSAMVVGLKLDLSMTAYVLLVPTIILLGMCFFKWKGFTRFLSGYTLFALFIFSLAIVADMKLYGYWGAKLDRQALVFLETPTEAMASLKIGELLYLIGLWLVMFGLFSYSFLTLVRQSSRNLRTGELRSLVGFVPVGLALFLALRGGITLRPLQLGIPLKIGAVYFHKNIFANHSAINVPWNVMYTLTHRKQLNMGYSFFPKEKASRTYEQLIPRNSGGFPKVLKTEKPNVIFIVLESFTAKAIEVLGGEEDVTPNLNKLAKEGMLFRNFYASGDRSDRGMVALFSGYPVMPLASVIRYPSKVQKLPNLFREFSNRNYQTAFYYGGDINFANFQSYFLMGGADKIVEKNDFPLEQHTSKWGVADDDVLQRFQQDLGQVKQPFFYSLFTLSSHEPFYIPIAPHFEGNEIDTKFKNSVYYTDQCIGHFIAEAKQQPWWDNTLIVMVADHGVRLINKTPVYSPEKYHIPMLWLGGALAVKDTVVDRYASQVDLASTLMSQLGWEDSSFVYSKNILDASNPDFSFFTYNHGYGWVNDSTRLSFDLNSKSYQEDLGQEQADTLGASFLQMLSEDFQAK